MGIKTVCAGLAVALSLAAQTPISVQVLNQTNPNAGLNGRLQSFMSTAFQPAEWDNAFFSNLPAADGLLWQLAPQHIRLQPVSQGVPMTGPNEWDFSTLNDVLLPVLNTGDHSPELQLATAPAFMSDSSGHILTTQANFQAFAAYCANVVRYYNTGGFDVNGTHYQSPSPYHITWWGIFNEPNINGLTASQYVTLYNTVVPAMHAADPTIKFVAIEESDFSGQSQAFVPTFVQQVTAPVDVVALHYYSTCNQTSTDQSIMGSIPGFLADLKYVEGQFETNPALRNVPVWITENNVNADYNNNGMSACNPGEVYHTDYRATDAFFAAWRPYLFSQLAQGGNQSLYHWDFDADAEFAEVDYTLGTTYLSYWTDYELAHLFPSPPGAAILQVNNSDPGALEALAVRNDDGSVAILLANHAVRSSSDNNGPGVAANVTLDVSALGSFSTANVTAINAGTSPSGPLLANQTVAANGTISILFPGYGVAFVRLAQAQPQISAGGIVNSATYAGGGVAPGELVDIFGQNLGPAAGLSSQASAGVVPNALSGVRVWFDGIAAPVLYASAGQLNVVAPYAIASETSTSVRVEYLGAFSPAVSVPVLAAQPGIFALNASGAGPAAVLNQDYSVNSPAHPAARGDYIMIYATGQGVASPAGTDGLIALAASSGPPPPALTVLIGGQAATVSYAGNAPGFVEGALQVNAMVPAAVTPGSAVSVVISVNGAASPAAATIAVQ